VKGVQYVVNERGKTTAVVIDLKTHSELWEDFHDAAVARERQSESRETLEAVKKRLRRRGKLRANG
jgi:DNA anti-recombination protein RmuC